MYDKVNLHALTELKLAKSAERHRNAKRRHRETDRETERDVDAIYANEN